MQAVKQILGRLLGRRARIGSAFFLIVINIGIDVRNFQQWHEIFYNDFVRLHI